MTGADCRNHDAEPARRRDATIAMRISKTDNNYRPNSVDLILLFHRRRVVCVCACVRACVCACVRACVRA